MFNFFVHSIVVFLTCYKFVTKTHNSPEGIFVTFITRDIGHGCESVVIFLCCSFLCCFVLFVYSVILICYKFVMTEEP